MTELAHVILNFEQVTGIPAVLWTRGPSSRLAAGAGRFDIPAPPVVDMLVPGGPTATIETENGILLAGAVPGRTNAWLGIGPCPAYRVAEADGFLRFLLPIVAHYFQSAAEVEHVAYELSERYEEINLLYTTSEILGHTVSLEEAARRILAEISETVGARRAAILVHERATNALQVVTSTGFAASDVQPIAVDDVCSVTARVFRTKQADIVGPDGEGCDAEKILRRGSCLAVPILWTNPGPTGSVPLGVVVLSDRAGGETFNERNEKLVSAIATQIGTAIQNARLVRSSVAQQQMLHEMQLASDLQMKLLPDPALVAPEARVAARVVPAESVGGDFYQLFRLSGGRTGIMVGDVSSHGYRAALIMALVMSASSIHAQATDDPAAMLNALLRTIRDELESTEMFISLFYAVLDPAAERMCYANTGHPHAFVVAGDGSIERLGALDPPLGMSDAHPAARERTWGTHSDVLLLFTDGVSDARDRNDMRLGEQRVLDLVRSVRAYEPTTIVDRVIGLVQDHTGGAQHRDDLTVVLLRT